jgi:hypothetical protein
MAFIIQENFEEKLAQQRATASTWICLRTTNETKMHLNNRLPFSIDAVKTFKTLGFL